MERARKRSSHGEKKKKKERKKERKKKKKKRKKERKKERKNFFFFFFFGVSTAASSGFASSSTSVSMVAASATSMRTASGAIVPRCRCCAGTMPDTRAAPRAPSTIQSASHREAGVAQALPVEAEPPRLDEHERAADCPSAFANRSIVTSTNGLARYFRSGGSGRNSTSRVVLSSV